MLGRLAFSAARQRFCSTPSGLTPFGNPLSPGFAPRALLFHPFGVDSHVLQLSVKHATLKGSNIRARGANRGNNRVCHRIQPWRGWTAVLLERKVTSSSSA